MCYVCILYNNNNETHMRMKKRNQSFAAFIYIHNDNICFCHEFVFHTHILLVTY